MIEAPEKEKVRKRRPKPDEEMDLMEHLDELRARLIRAVIYVCVAGVIAWYWAYPAVFNGMLQPLQAFLAKNHIEAKLIYTGITEPFFLQLKISLMLAVAMASPLLLLEVWGFISPGLHPHERKPFLLVFPMAVFLFAFGAGLSYFILPQAFGWFLSYLPISPDVSMLPRIQDYMLFVVKMCGAFGLGFEMPVVLMFLGKIGLINARTMWVYWRQAVVLIMIAAAILTPSNDPFSMMLMATPMALLYLGSIFLVKWVQPKVEIVDYDEEEEEAPKGRRPAPIDLDEED